MRNILLIIAFLIFTSCNRTFITEINTRGTNLLYTDVDNVIEINSNSQKEIFATVNNGEIEKLEPKIYSIKVKNFLPTILTIKQGSIESKFEFRTRSMPNPEIYFQFENETSHKSKYSASEFRKLKSIFPILNTFDYACEYEIGNFDVIKIGKNGTRKVYHVTKKLPTYIIDDTEPGDVFLFSNIEVNFIGKFEKKVIVKDVSIIIE